MRYCRFNTGPDRTGGQIGQAGSGHDCGNRVPEICDETARPELRKLLMLAIGPACFGATWRSGYAAVCKTVYTSSILVVASSNKINALGLMFQALPEALRMAIGFGFALTGLARFRAPRP